MQATAPDECVPAIGACETAYGIAFDMGWSFCFDFGRRFDVGMQRLLVCCTFHRDSSCARRHKQIHTLYIDQV
jgi:hypothetical protein